MSLSTRIAPHLPYLRRYARAVMGSQTSGDAYVSAVLEALIADISVFPEASNDRISLYKLFAALIGSTSIEIGEIDSPFAWERRAAKNLMLIPTTSRQAFLLMALESFGPSEISEILDVEPDDVSGLIEQAAQEISRQVRTDIMIIEDEPFIAMDIEQMVEGLGHHVTGIARTHKEAVDLFERTNPKMILADIQLADGSSGIEAVNEILQDVPVPVIFITAYPERLLTGERPEPAFLVTKPFNPDMVKALISQALFFDQSAELAA